MKKKHPRLPIVTTLAELPPGYVPMGEFYVKRGHAHTVYKRLLRAAKAGDVPAVRFFANGLTRKAAPVYVHETEARAFLAKINARKPEPPPVGTLFSDHDEPPALVREIRSRRCPVSAILPRIRAAATVAELGMIGDELERLESAGELKQLEAAELLGAINGRHDELEPVATVAASLAAGHPGTVDRLAASLERVAEALEEILRRGRVELDLEPCT